MFFSIFDFMSDLSLITGKDAYWLKRARLALRVNVNESCSHKTISYRGCFCVFV